MSLLKTWKPLDLKNYADLVYPKLDLEFRESLYFNPKYIALLEEKFNCLVIRSEPLACCIFYSKFKFGLPIVTQPFLVQQAGLTAPISDLEYKKLMWWLKLRFVKVHIAGNQWQYFPDIKLKLRSNYILSLQKPLEELFKGFKTNRKRNLKKQSIAKICLHQSINSNLIQQYLKESYPLFTNFKLENVFDQFLSRLLGLHALGYLEWHTAELDSVRIAHIATVKWQSNRYLFFVYSTELGNEFDAVSHILYQYFQLSISTNTCFDFEGSDVPGVGRFYQSFGSEKNEYQTLIGGVLS